MTQPYEQTSRPLRKRQIILNNFMGGVFWGLGATIGLSIFIAILVLSPYINFVPIIGSLSQILLTLFSLQIQTFIDNFIQTSIFINP